MRFHRIAILILCASFMSAQQRNATELLARALHFAELYNWDDAGPDFTEAERLFTAAGDQRNALYAKLGRIRSNIDVQQQTLPGVAAQLSEALADDPLLQNDKQLRMFCLIVKGDIDTEINTGAMKQDWTEVQTLARALGDARWQYRALAQLGIAAFYDTDLDTARIDAGAALQAATKADDIGAQIRILTILTDGLLESKMYTQALASIENAIKLANATPDTGDQFVIQERRIAALIGMRQFDTAQRINQEVLARAQQEHRGAHEATLYGLAADIAEGRNDRDAALRALQQGMRLGEATGYTRELATLDSQAAEIYRSSGDLEKAEHFAELSSTATQESGNLWGVPEHLQALAALQIARGRYSDADRSYQRAEAFLDSLIGSTSSLIEQTAVIAASSQIYSQHFALIADRFHNPQEAYNVIEQARARGAADLLASGVATPTAAKTTERVISRLRLKLMAARSTSDVLGLRDQIFMEEQARWVAPGANVLKQAPREAVSIQQVQQALGPSSVLLEYVVADPNAYCLVISRNGSRIVELGSKAHIDALVASYIKAVKAKLSAAREARSLYDALLRPIAETAQKRDFIVVPDGQLYLVPFDALIEPSGHYVVESRTVTYSPSATTFFLLNNAAQRRPAAKALLAVGGIPYAQSSVNRAVLTHGFNRAGFADLPSSADEVRIAASTFRGKKVDLLMGRSATEAAFKREPLDEYRVIHLAVHGFADSTFPDRAALILMSDPVAGEDGFLQASEIVQLRFNAQLIVLSACETAVGPLQGQEGVANLSQAFLLAGARSVISTLWQVDDSASLFLMKHFYAHLAMNQLPPAALTAAKRDMLRTFGAKAVPYDWAAFTLEGVGERPSNVRGQAAR